MTDDTDGTDKPPVAPCTVTWSERSSYWAVVVPRCPLCGRRHYHGGGTGPAPDLGHRNAHCVAGSGSYELVEAPASIEARARRAAWAPLAETRPKAESNPARVRGRSPMPARDAAAG